MQNKSVNFTLKLLCTAMTAVFVTGAYAQQTQGGAAAGAVQVEEIQITGSRIRNVSSMSTPTPVTAVSQEEITNFNPGSTVAEALDNLPQFFGTNTAQRGGGAISTTAGGSYLNLRGMGLNRTLVLMDGSRIIPADANNSVNIDNFPNNLVKRVDVVTGGASAAYGADAVAGVVNFVLDRNFEGLKTSVSTGVSEFGDGQNYKVSVAGGTSMMDKRLHLIGSFETRNVNQIEPDPTRLANWKDYGLVANPAWKATDPAGTNPRRITMPYVFPNNGSPQGLIIAPATFSLLNYTFTDDGKGVRPYAFGTNSSAFTASQSGGQEYNYNNASKNRGPDGNEVIQRSGFVGAKYDVNDQLTLTAQAMLGRTESNFLGQRSNMSIAGATYGFTLFSGNPYLPKAVQDAMTAANIPSFIISKQGMVNVPGGVNIYDNHGDRSIGILESETVGFEYNLTDGWNLTGHYQTGQSKVDTGVLNIPRIDKFFMGMDAIVSPTSGKTVCNITQVNPTADQLKAFMAGKKLPSPISVDGVTGDSPIGPMDPATCVPYNILGLANANQAAKDWLTDQEKKQTRLLNQDFAELLLSGEIYKGWGAGPVSMAVGATWRSEDFNQYNFPSYGERGVLNAPALGIRDIPTGFASAGNRSLHPFSAIGVGGADSSVTEEFAELNVPVWKFSDYQTIGIDLAYRNSKYSSSGNTPSWKFGLDAQLFKDLRWRYTRSHDVREPNFAERFLTATGGGSITDKQLGNASNGTLTVLASPNPSLKPEKATTVTTGLVYQPSFAPWTEGVQVALDWYQITLKDALGRLGAQRLADDCFATKDPATCALISRDPATQVVTRILDQFFNVAGAQVRGVDLEVQYSMKPDWIKSQEETLTVRALGGFVGENSTTSAAGTTVDAINGQERPHYKADLTVNYQVGDWGFSLLEHYYGHTLVNNTFIQGVDIDNNRVASQLVTNLAVSYKFKGNSRHDWKTTFNVTNLLNRDPPIIATTSGQFLSNSFDQYGRRYQLTVDMNF